MGRGRGNRIREFYFFPGLENRFVDRSRECSLACLNELKGCFFFFFEEEERRESYIIVSVCFVELCESIRPSSLFFSLLK